MTLRLELCGCPQDGQGRRSADHGDRTWDRTSAHTRTPCHVLWAIGLTLVGLRWESRCCNPQKTTWQACNDLRAVGGARPKYTSVQYILYVHCPWDSRVLYSTSTVPRLDQAGGRRPRLAREPRRSCSQPYPGSRLRGTVTASLRMSGSGSFLGHPPRTG